MNLEKLFGSKTKVDILKYLLFRRQWVSMRALEGELDWTFPAIKKQIDSLEESWVLDIKKENAGFSITLSPTHYELFRNFFLISLREELVFLFSKYSVMIDKFFPWKRFWIPLEMDLVVIYQHMERPQLDQLKNEIAQIFRNFLIENVSIVFMTKDDREKRYRLADKFVLQVMRFFPDKK